MAYNKNTLKDEMTPGERMDAMKSGRPIDRIPCSCHVSEYGCRLLGIPLDEYHHSSELMANATVEVYKKFGFDSISVSPGLLGLPEAMGSSLVFSKSDRPQLLEPAFVSYSEIKRIEKFDPEHDGRLPLFLDALVLIDKSIGSEVKPGTGTGGAFTTAALLRGTDDFLKDLILFPDSALALLELTTEAVIRFVKSANERDFSCSLSEPLASGDVISPAQFRKFVKPSLTKICSWMKENTGRRPTLHICGDTKLIWQDMADTGASFLSLDNKIDLEEAKKTVGNIVGLNGNVPPIEVLMNGTVGDVVKAVKTCIRKAYDTPCGYVLSSGCTIPLDSPPENISAMMDTAREFGRFPVDVDRLK